MPNCVALGCSNRYKNGYTMKIFPKDPVRRKKWIEMVNRKDWTPTINSYLCDIHFAPDMWEKPRQDGKQKLKFNAIPTLFRFKTKPEPKKLQIKQTPVATIVDSHNSNNTMLPVDIFDINVRNEEQIEINVNPLLCIPINLNKNKNEINIDKKQLEITQLQSKLLQYEKHYRKSVNINIMLKKCLSKTKHELKRQQSAGGLQDKLAKVFNPDQIQCLKRNSTRFMKWSNKTLENAYKLRASCGNKGYIELLRQNFPLPSLRTLRRYRSPEKIQINAETETCQDFQEFPSALRNNIPEVSEYAKHVVSITMPTNVLIQNSHILDHDYTILGTVGSDETR